MISMTGRALLFLLPEEIAFLKYLKAAKVNLQGMWVKLKCLFYVCVHTKMIKTIEWYL